MVGPRAGTGNDAKAPTDREEGSPAQESETTAVRMMAWLDARAHAEERHGRPAITARLREIRAHCAPSYSVAPATMFARFGDEEAPRLGESIHEALRQATNEAYGSGTDCERIVSDRLKNLAAQFYRDFLSKWAQA